MMRDLVKIAKRMQEEEDMFLVSMIFIFVFIGWTLPSKKESSKLVSE